MPDILSTTHVVDYREKGYTVVKGIIDSAVIERCRQEAERLWSLPGLLDDLNIRAESRKNSEGKLVLDRLDPVLDLSEAFQAAVMNPQLMKALTILLDDPAALLKCKLIKKDPGTKGYLHHQDFLYWRWLNMLPSRLCSVAIPLYPCNAASGAIELFPSEHHRLIASEDGDPDRDFDISLIDETTGEIPELNPGDVLIFHSLAPHRSGPNRSNLPRTLLLPSYAGSLQADLYSTYYKREIIRRCSVSVGFERFFSQSLPTPTP